MYVNYANLQVVDCNFTANSAVGEQASGGAIFVNNSAIAIVRTTFDKNVAALFGGAVAVAFNDTIAAGKWAQTPIGISSSAFTGNTVSSKTSVMGTAVAFVYDRVNTKFGKLRILMVAGFLIVNGADLLLPAMQLSQTVKLVLVGAVTAVGIWYHGFRSK